MDAMAEPVDRIPVGIDEPGDCSCCSTAATPDHPVFRAGVVDPVDGTEYPRLCGPCFDVIEGELEEARMRAVA